MFDHAGLGQPPPAAAAEANVEDGQRPLCQPQEPGSTHAGANLGFEVESSLIA
jgi:hypothetical protein